MPADSINDTPTDRAPDQAAPHEQGRPTVRPVPETMTAVTARGYGQPDLLAVETDVLVPSPGPGEMLIEVHASSLNALDWHFLTGTPYFLRLMAGLRTPKRLTPGADVAGLVAAVGEGVTEFAVGDAVFGECEGGGCGEYLLVTPAQVVAIPDGVSFEDAAATPVAGLTAVQGLRTHAGVQPADHVLVNGAAGGVGTFAVQIAKALGATVTAVCSTTKVDMVRGLGADEVVDYKTEDVVPGGPRFDVMLDNVGNHPPRDVKSMLRPGARYVAVSGPKDNKWLDPMPRIIGMALALWRADASFHQFTASPKTEDLTYLAEALADGRIVPAIDRVVGLDGVVDGMVEIGSGHARSKIVVVPHSR
ncbi:MAG: NAD(P)-dependent alcohol dehydrogenase [Actinomycetota bacterium]